MEIRTTTPRIAAEHGRSSTSRQGLRRRFTSHEAVWLADSWREWEQRLDAWIAAHDPPPADVIVLRMLWLEEAKHYDWLWRRYRVYHRLLRVTLIVAGVLTPLLVQAGETTLATVSSALAGVAAGLDAFFNWGERVQKQRQTADRLKDEGTAFLAKQDPYGVGDETDFQRFKNVIASITKKHRSEYESARTERSGQKPSS